MATGWIVLIVLGVLLIAQILFWLKPRRGQPPPQAPKIMKEPKAQVAAPKVDDNVAPELDW